MSKATYSTWETGRSELGAERLLALSAALGCSADDILGTHGTERRYAVLTPEEDELLGLLRRAPADVRDSLADLLRALSAEKGRGVK